MPSNVYECMFLLDTNLVSGEVSAAADKIHGILQKHKVEVLASRPWDERRLTYPIKNDVTGHYQKKGLYYLTYFRGEGSAISPMQEDFRLSDMILRSLVLKIAPQFVDTMLELARDENAVALHNYTDDDVLSGPTPRRNEPDAKKAEDTATESVADGAATTDESKDAESKEKAEEATT